MDRLITTMKTYTTTIEKPRLIITADQDIESPREDDNMGLFLTSEKNHESPDGTKDYLYDIMIEMGDVANSTDDHISSMLERIKEANIKVTHIFPVVRYEHGSVAYKIGTQNGFDYSNCGFYFVLERKLKDFGLKKTQAKRIEDIVVEELQYYTKWFNGDVYRYTLFDKSGGEQDSCGGFYDIEDIRADLPKEWKCEDLTKYITY